MTNERELRNVIDIIHGYSFFLPNSYFDWIDWLAFNNYCNLMGLYIFLERNVPVIIPMFNLLRFGKQHH